MNTKLLAAMVMAGVLAAPAAIYAQGTTTAPKDRPAAAPMKKDTPAASTSTTTGTSTKGTKGGDSPDAVITGKIKAKFIKDKIVRSRSYNVDTDKGVVVVKGTARSQAEADRAIELAKNTEGVSSVTNQITVTPKADRSKRDSVKRDQPRDRSTADAPRRDTTAAGAATRGEPSKDRSASASKDKDMGKEGSPDAVITTKIKTEYAKDKAVSATRISVDTEKGVVRLSGTAKTKDEADKAVAIAKSVKGVTSVKNDIKVEAK